MKTLHQLIFGLIAIVLLTGCAHSLYLQSRETGDTAKGKATGAGSNGELTVEIKQRHYEGRWTI